MKMAALESEKMKKARDLIVNRGLSAYAAAKQSGISAPAIYMAKWYKDFKAGQK